MPILDLLADSAESGDTAVMPPQPGHPTRHAYSAQPAHSGRFGRLGVDTLAALPAWVGRPAFDVRTLRPGILHLGCGAFHRAHQALMTQRAIQAECGRWPPRPAAWGIVASSLRRPGTLQALRRQDGLYSVMACGADLTTIDVVGTVCDTVFAPDDTATLLRYFGDRAIHIVTLTITSSGYCMDPNTGRLDGDHPDIHHDLRTGAHRTAISLLVRGLNVRRAMGLRPPVVLSCDNVQHNGRVLRQACIDYAALQSDGLAEWVARHVQFPCSMVDRIVPSAPPGDDPEVIRHLGMADGASVRAEPFLQWVIERFDGPRPLWEAAGAEFVADVGPWEASKLRLLNGGHLLVAYLGLLAGYDTVQTAMEDPLLADLALRFMIDEQMPTLPPSDHDIRAYAGQLVARWRNPAIGHRLDRVGRDGTGKMSGRLLASLRDNLRDGRPAPCTLLAIAAWMRCATGLLPPGSGNLLAPEPCLAPVLRAVAVSGGHEPAAIVNAFLDRSGVFDDTLRRDANLRAALIRAMTGLHRGGIHRAMATCLSGGWQ
jgi:fructuronate reductase